VERTLLDDAAVSEALDSLALPEIAPPALDLD
jgi:hypothetical protein